jgi:acetylornithine deacetylase/succinyl-diaminopimelate desuccinylase-like protein
MPILLCLVVLFLTGAAPRAQQATLPPAVRAAADKITADALARDLHYLASDSLEGRNTPSPGFDKAADYIAERLKAAGLKPLGDNGTYFQAYTMRESRVDTAAAYLDVNGRRFRFGDDFVVRSFAGPLSGSFPIVYVGHGWTVPAHGIDPYAGVDVKGKIVLAHGPRALPKGIEILQIGRISVGASSPLTEAGRRGAAGIIFIPQTRALSDWDQMRGQNTVRRELDPNVPSAYASAGVSSVLLSRSATEALLAGERVDGPTLIGLGDSADYPASFQLGKQAVLHLPASTIDHRPYNVVAMIEGSDPVLRNESITIESHLDGAVGTRTVDGDGIYNSADDNASGSAATLAIAEQLMTAPRPKRSIVFIWDSGEERGLWGTRYFVHQPPVPLDTIVAHFNIDMIGANRAPGSPDATAEGTTGPHEVYIIGPGVLSAQADALLEAVNRSYLNLRFNRDHDRAESEFFYPRTDAGPFLERGILTIGFTTGIHDRYHAPSDEAQFLDPKKMEAITRTVLASAWMLADAADRPRVDKSIPATVPRYK